MAAKLCVRFLVLTAARSGEARGARWEEVESTTWTVPARRMKERRAHRVPLSGAALATLVEARILDDGSDLVFPLPAPTAEPALRHDPDEGAARHGTCRTRHGPRVSLQL